MGCIELMVSGPTVDPNTFIKVVSRRLFDTCWHPVAIRRGLHWVQMMGTGFTVLPRDLPDIVAELEVVSAELAAEPPERGSIEELAVARAAVSETIASLREFVESRGLDVYVG